MAICFRFSAAVESGTCEKADRLEESSPCRKTLLTQRQTTPELPKEADQDPAAIQFAACPSGMLQLHGVSFAECCGASAVNRTTRAKPCESH